MKRVPLWLTIVPLVLAVAGYWYVWSGYRDDFRAEIARVLPGAAVSIGGFPYRLEATVTAPRLASGGGVAGRATAARAVLNRGPWQRDLTIVRSTDPRVVARLPALAASGIAIAAPAAESSLHIDKDGKIARLSSVFDRPQLGIALIGVRLTAIKLEVHFRETPGRSAEAWSPTLPQRAQVVLAGEDLRTAAGVPLRLAADLRVTGPTRLIDYARWATTGTVEIHALTLGDKTGEVLRLDATLLPAGGVPRLAGTITTVCPASVAAALAGTVVSEQRLRLPVRLAFGGTPGAWRLGALPGGVTRAVRAQQPPCPRLR